MEVVPGIHKVDGTWGGNVYLLDGGDSLTQVDAALPFNGRRIRRYIRSMGRTVSDVRQLVLTHAHPDHTGSIHSLFGDSGVPTLVHEADTLRSGSGRRLYYRGQLFSLPGKLPLCSRIPRPQPAGGRGSPCPPARSQGPAHARAYCGQRLPAGRRARSPHRGGHAHKRRQELPPAGPVSRHRLPRLPEVHRAHRGPGLRHGVRRPRQARGGRRQGQPGADADRLHVGPCSPGGSSPALFSGAGAGAGARARLWCGGPRRR